MKKFANFTVIFLMVSLFFNITSIIIIENFFVDGNVIIDILDASTFSLIVLGILLLGFYIAGMLAFFYETIIFEKFIKGKTTEDRQYKHLLFFRFACVIIMMFCIINGLVQFWESAVTWCLTYVPQAVSIVWIILVIKSKPFEENLDYVNPKKSISVGIKVLVISLIIIFGSMGCNYLNEMSIYGGYRTVNVQALLSKKIIMDKTLTKTYMNKNTPLHLSAKAGNNASTSIILNAAVSYDRIHNKGLFERVISAKNKDGKTPIDLIREENKNNPALSKIEAMKMIRRINDTHIHDREIIDEVEKRNIPVGITFPINERTLLSYAVETKRIELMNYLINKGASANIVFNRNNTYYISPTYIKSNLLMIPLDGGIKTEIIKETGKIIGYEKFTEKNVYDICRILLEHGADPNFPSNDGFTPFMLACEKSENINLIKLFLDKGASAKLRAVNGDGPIESWHFYSRNKKRDFAILKLLMDAGADPFEKRPVKGDSFYDEMKRGARSGNFEQEVVNFLDKVRR